MKTKIKITISLLITLMSFMTNLGPVYAQEDTGDTKCIEEMKPFMEGKSAEFRTYLNQHFQSKKTNTSLLDLALKRFEVYKKDLRTKYATYFPQQGFKLYESTTQTLNCEKIMNDEIQTMELLLKSYYKQTSNIKTSTAFMTKLQQMNKKLDALVMSVTQMLGKWGTLKDRIPCFVKQCL